MINAQQKGKKTLSTTRDQLLYYKAIRNPDHFK